MIGLYGRKRRKQLQIMRIYRIKGYTRLEEIKILVIKDAPSLDIM